MIGLAAGIASACGDGAPSALRDTYDYEARFETLTPPDTIHAMIRFTEARGDSVFGDFEDLDPDPMDAQEFGTVFPLSGRLRGAALELRVMAPGLRIDHEGTRSQDGFTGTCRADVVGQPDPFPCTFVMRER